MAFAPGQSGNPGGRPKRDKLFRDALIVALKRADEQGVEAIQRIADRLVKEAETAENPVPAIKEIAERTDGKVPQAVVGDDEHDPINLIHRIERVIVDPANPDSTGVSTAAEASTL